MVRYFFLNLAELPTLLTASDLFVTKTVTCLNPQSLRNANFQLSSNSHILLPSSALVRFLFSQIVFLPFFSLPVMTMSLQLVHLPLILMYIMQRVM